jgi:hypothetical protein
MVSLLPLPPTSPRIIHPPSPLLLQLSKGAPHILLSMSHNADELRVRVKGAVQELADRGFRSLGVSVSFTGPDEEPHWELQVCTACGLHIIATLWAWLCTCILFPMYLGLIP